ncbi:hypothetical protein CMV_005737 [Castanea mollissima]|uniref:Secreted protein n=1 Tax=Castanea mollissima TaxID=60419 RepID=A0A8J4RJ84_9ROSI|nr:hypothetical protein CMV_005737 [Castanea mollissima]
MVNRCEIFCEILIAILLPPLGVCLRHGCCTVEFWLCVLSTLLHMLDRALHHLAPVLAMLYSCTNLPVKCHCV